MALLLVLLIQVHNATFSYWRNLIKRAKEADNLKDKFAIFLMGPKWTPKNVNHLDPVLRLTKRNKRKTSFLSPRVENGILF